LFRIVRISLCNNLLLGTNLLTHILHKVLSISDWGWYIERNLLFLIYITDLCLAAQVSISKFASGAKLENIMNFSEKDIDNLQEDIDRLVEWAHT